jgi:co-chaperonin GroES (HSP10)
MGRTVRPLKNKLIIQQDAPKTMSRGLHLPQGSRDLYEDLGTVIAVGADVKDVVAGDRVLFKRRPGSALNPDRREGESDLDNLLVLLEEDILGVVTGE